MSVSSMKKLTVFTYAADSEAMIRRLMSLRCVHIDEADAKELGEILPSAKVNCDARRAELESSISRINEAINILDKYTHRKKSLFGQKTSVKIDKFIKDGFADEAFFVRVDGQAP